MINIEFAYKNGPEYKYDIYFKGKLTSMEIVVDTELRNISFDGFPPKQYDELLYWETIENIYMRYLD